MGSFGSKKKKVAKKSGPKGKKARSKAKLERQWGEAVDDNVIQSARIRKGRSRLLPSSSRRAAGSTKGFGVAGPDNAGAAVEYGTEHAAEKDAVQQHPSAKRQRRYGLDNDDDDDDASSSSSCDSEEEDAAGGGMGGDGGGAQHRDALRDLLRRIGGSGGAKEGRGRRVMSVDEGDDEGSASSSSSSEESSEEGSDDDGDSSSDDDDADGAHAAAADDAAAGTTTAMKDPYEAHFSRPPLPEGGDEATTPTARPALRKLATVPPGLDRSLEVRVAAGIDDDGDNNDSDAGGGAGAPLASPSASSPSVANGLFRAHGREVLQRNWDRYNQSAVKKARKKKKRKATSSTVFTPLQATIYPSLARYADVLLTAVDQKNRDEVHNVLALHVLNHVLTSRSRVQRHNKRIKELSERAAADDDGRDGKPKSVAGDEHDEADEDRWRDQGYTRPKVLVLLPTRGTCLSFVKGLLRLLGGGDGESEPSKSVADQLDRFEAEYGVPPEEVGGGGGGGGGEVDDDGIEARRKSVLEAKGPAWQELFGDAVNDDDDFKLGISLTPHAAGAGGGGGGKKQKGKAKKGVGERDASGGGGVSVKLYSEFYRSDLIVASPLGLKMATAREEEGDDETGDVDFLSSIEICLLLHSDVLLMQNWDHVNSVLESTCLQPKKSNDTDFSRVRNYLLAGQAAHWRQLILASSFTYPYLLSTFKRHAKSISGQMKIRQRVSSDDASICDVLVRLKQVFQRVPCQSIINQGNDRLKYFGDKVLPHLMRLQQKHTLIFIPSYFDFVSVRNLLLKKEVDFVSVTEYARVSEVSRGRARFHQGRKNIMLYTGRAHFFLRHTIKGARHIIFFGLPEHSEFYSGLVNMLRDGSERQNIDSDGGLLVDAPSSCLSLFTKYDAHQLERIVGTSHCERMVKGEKGTYLFCA